MARHLPRPGDLLSTLSTPVPVVDEDRMAANIRRVQDHMTALGRAFRPHIKTHKIPALAREQVAAGASGITCQKISEAGVFADAGFDDILISYVIVGRDKLDELAALNARIRNLKVVADSPEGVDGLAARFNASRPLTVLVECDSGGGRCGVQTPDEAIALAQRITGYDGLVFGGLMTFPKTGGAADAESFLAAAIAGLAGHGIACPIVSSGGTPDLFDAALTPSATEHRAGTYIYNDRAMVREGHASLDQCAMHVLATVISRPNANRAVIDAGSKTLTSDLFGFSDYGHIVEYPQAVIRSLSEEHGVVDLSTCANKPVIGERVRIVPNHTCVVSNMFDAMTFHRDGLVTRVLPVAARGLVW